MNCDFAEFREFTFEIADGPDKKVASYMGDGTLVQK